MKRMKLNKKLRGTIICIGFVFLFALWFWNAYQMQKNELQSVAYLAFVESMKEEAALKIMKQVGFYDPKKSSNDIPREEKKKWCDQDLLTFYDPNRHVLDSLYNTILKEKHIKAKSAICCIRGGKVIHTSADSTIYKESNLLPPITYRIDDNAEKNITLQAYVDISSWMILSRMGWFLLIWFLFLIMAGVGVWYSQRMMNYAKLRMSKLFNLLRVAHNDSVQKAEEIKRKEIELVELQEINSQKLQQAESINREQAELIKQKEAELIKLKEESANELQQAKSALRMKDDLIIQKEAELNNYKEYISTKLHKSESTNREQEEIIKQKESELVKLKEESANELQQARATNQEQLELIKQKEAEIAELKNNLISMRTTNKTTWMYLPCDLLFNEKCGELRYKNQQSVFLTGNLYRLFCCFINSEDYEVTFEDICVGVMARSVKGGINHSGYSTASANISRLKILLKPFPFIKIDPIRKIGYKMYFTDYQNDITLQGKSD